MRPVVGIGVLPWLGAFIADRTGLGNGAFVAVGIDPTDPKLESPAALTAISLRPSIAVGLVVGVPLGVVAGRFAWEAFADQLGVVSRVDIPFAWLAAIGAVAVVLALVAVAIPARTAARVHASELLIAP